MPRSGVGALRKCRLAADGTLRVSIGARYPLEQAADAHAAIESQATTGKVILLP
ncbi:zinc-binding dehydrogenase [uncultured Arthrobacter sp.]|uniref:zinc-binding dehydrogenase n=1 Tax=uncultured Arthrobacter sp. TaxID=114050 RepID=UPI0028D74BAB|nr:zinc-binding dehydrogenase [uncultured Arthrobacter sp.]